ncbi:Eco57I restriction-modification methylase domain-containing protein [Sutcliffiella rhizosphaerae]|uniref:site-specific DNA-methyltransferase (adenine-specific) n=1 Tax=Sutcliffiella rhizosphaerae TaxID=2880967 RepID=A0ABN8AGL8_9BACI|nr:N-6 DNA methylase [Sutcliffiella rhizosphaerae]CAG9623267.1 hypothetical protein BACCIP111883_04063 [Sutcliffiella rhizosphaerae]
MMAKKYIFETVDQIKKNKNIKMSDLQCYYLLYAISFCSRYIEINAWSKDLNSIDFKELKTESMEKLNKSIFSELDLENKNLFFFFNWLKKHPPFYTTEDILGSIYVLCSGKEQRKKLGEHYTQNELVEFILTELGDELKPTKKIIDPACGSGNFLVRILGAFLEKGSFESNQNIVNNLIAGEFIIGVDIQKIPCLITKLRMLMEVVYYQKVIDPNIEFPIYQVNSLLENHEFLEDNSFDLVITNPPYLRYQLIDQDVRKKLKDIYYSATGRFDLYPIFIEKSLKLVKELGKVIVLCSDKFMATQYGRGIREYVGKNAELLKVYDLSAIFPFEAAVLSAVYFFEKHTNNNIVNNSDWFKVINDVEVLSKKRLGNVIIDEKWRYVEDTSEAILKKILNNSNILLGDIISKVSIGVQTTADNVFCKEMTNDFVLEKKLEKEVLHPLLRGRNLKKWTYTWSGDQKNKDTNILYPYENLDGVSIPIQLNDYSNVKKYLLEHKTELSNRTYFMKQSSKKWFEHWTPRSFNTFSGIKILTPDLSSYNKFSLDTKGYFYNGTVYGIKLKNEYILNDYKYLLGILNSNVLSFFHKQINSTHLHSKKYRFQAPTIKEYPLVFLDRETNEYTEIVRIVDEILNTQTNISFLEGLLNDIVYRVYKLEIEDRGIIEAFCES